MPTLWFMLSEYTLWPILSHITGEGELVRCRCDDLCYQSTHHGLLGHTPQGGWNCQVYLWWFTLSEYTLWPILSHITGGVNLSGVDVMIYIIRVHIMAYLVIHHRGGETVRCTCDDLHYQSTHCDLLGHTSQEEWIYQEYLWWFILSEYTSWCTWSHITGGVDLSSVHVMIYTIRVHIMAHLITHHRKGELAR